MAIFPKEKKKAPKMAHHDRSHYLRTSMAPGLGYPIYCRPVFAGDQLQLDFKHLMNTQAILNPLYGSYRLQICVFFAGTSLYIPRLWRNGSMSDVYGILDANYPTISMGTDSQSANILPLVNESSLLSYLGFGYHFGDPEVAKTPYQFNAIPVLMYYDIFRHYYANRQEADFYVMMHDWIKAGRRMRYGLDALDCAYLSLPVNGGTLDEVKNFASTPIHDLFKSFHYSDIGMSPGFTQPLGGLFCATYMPDRMNVILNETFFRKNVSTVVVSTVGDSFQVDQLVTAKKLWNARNNDVITNGTFKDWVRVHFGVTPKIMDDMPTFCGATSSDILFEDIRATTSAKIGGLDQYLGDKGSSALGYGDSRTFRIDADRPGYVMAIATLVPRVDYNQFTDRYVRHQKLSDDFMPEYNGIGYQDVLVGDLLTQYAPNWNLSSGTTPSKDPFANSVGKQPAWIEHMTDVNRVRGTFCSTENSWVLARDMSVEGEMVSGAYPTDYLDSSAYIDPGVWNQPFADESPTAQNFYAQFYIRDRVRSTILKRLRPKF